ncbi:MAG TPA: GntR family transcriptional regulator [Thermodesulfobacteriota bacterium]|nr:GntR family transcriptional regulator [Thermodesulfobacteriota bacterium]
MSKAGTKAAKGPDVYALLRQAITSGRYIPGQRLSERELAAHYGVSRTPIREAFRHLIQEGLVDYETHRGYRIISLSEERARNIMVVRENLEGLAARLATLQDAKGTARAMRKTIAEARRAHAEGQLSDLITINQGFHQALVEKSGNSVLSAMYRTLQGYIGLMMSVSLSWPRRPGETIREHEEIIRALKSGKPEAAERAVRRHIRNALEGVLRNVKQYLGKTASL